MAKVQKLSDIQQEIAFTEFDFYLRYEESFKNEIKNATMQPDVLRVERDFTGVVAPDVTENEKIGPETRTEDIKSDEFDRKNTGKSAG